MCITEENVRQAIDDLKDKMQELGDKFSPADLLASVGVSEEASLDLFNRTLSMIDPPVSQAERVSMAVTMLMATLAIAMDTDTDTTLNPESAIGDDFFDSEFLRELGIDNLPQEGGE